MSFLSRDKNRFIPIRDKTCVGPILKVLPPILWVRVQVRKPCRAIFNPSWFPQYGTISWKTKSLSYRNFGKISPQLHIELVSVSSIKAIHVKTFSVHGCDIKLYLWIPFSVREALSDFIVIETCISTPLCRPATMFCHYDLAHQQPRL